MKMGEWRVEMMGHIGDRMQGWNMSDGVGKDWCMGTI